MINDMISPGMSVDTTVEYELQAQFWGIFSQSIDVSVSTGYDWGHVSSETRSVALYTSFI